MKKEFITYEQALALKELGFDEECFAFYNGKFLDYKIQGGDICSPYLSTENIGECPNAPTFSQTFRWIRKKYNLKGFIGFRPNVKQFDCHVYDMSLSGKEYVEQRTLEEFNKDPKVGTYEEAELACLKKLIEIVKQK